MNLLALCISAVRPCNHLTPTAFYCGLNSSAPCTQSSGILFLMTFFKSGGISSHTTPRHLLPCSHAWSLNVLRRLEERLPLSQSLAQGKSRELLRAQGRMTSHSNTCTLILKMHAHRHTLCSTWQTHTHSVTDCRLSPGSAPLTACYFAMTTGSRPCPS